MKNLWMKAAAGAAIIAAVGGASIVGASMLSSSEEPEVSAEQALQEAIAKTDGVVREVELTSEEEKNYYEIGVESTESGYDFMVDATSGEFLKEEPDQQPAVDNEFNKTSEAADYEEYNVIEEKVETDNLTYYLSTDNQGNRILFLLDENGVKQFKTIFLKYNEELKIINLSNGDLVYKGNV